jgi:hypothetical protein
MVGLALRLRKGKIIYKQEIAKAYSKLLENDAYKAAYIRATSDDESVKNRLKIATGAFDEVS